MMTDTEETKNEELEAPGQRDEEDTVNEIWDNLEEGRRHLVNWRIAAREDYDFAASHQWSEDDKAKLEEEGRPCVTFNRIARTLAAVIGMEVQNRQEVRYTPRGVEDSGYSDVLYNAARWVRDNCDAEDEESDSFEDALTCGMGWVETRVDYEIDPEGKVFVDRIDPLEMIYDPTAKKHNLVDARWVARVKEMPKKEFKSQWPDADVEPGKFWNDSEQPHDATNAWKYENDSSDKLSRIGTVSVIEYQCWKRVSVYKVLSENGNFVELDEHKFNKLLPHIEMQGLRYVKLKKRKYHQYFLVGKKILEQNELGCEHFTFTCITGRRDKNKNTWTGIVSIMKDPQRWANKWLSQIQHIINSNAKGGLMAEVDAFKSPRKAEDEWAETNSITWLNPGGLQKVQQKEAPRYPEGLDRLLQHALQSINDVPGVNLELMGMADRDQAIGLEETRKQAGTTMLASFFDSLRRYRKIQGRILAYFIREYIADGRLIRIVGQEGQQYIPLLKDKLAFEYDIIVEDAPTSPNIKERVFKTLVQLIPMVLQAGIPVPPEILDYSPLPETLTTKWKQMLNPPPDPLAEQMKQIEMMMGQLALTEKQAQIQKISSDVTLNYAKAEQAQAIGQDESAQAMQKMGMSQMESQMKEEAMYKEHARKDLEMALRARRDDIKQQMDARRADTKMQMDARIKAQQVNRANMNG